MVLERASRALIEQKLPVPEPGPTELLVRVRCTGVCRTDLHILDGELPSPRLPLVMGHQIVGTVVTSRPLDGEPKCLCLPTDGLSVVGELARDASEGRCNLIHFVDVTRIQRQVQS